MYTYKFNNNRCWYKGVCNEFESEYCNQSCMRFAEMDFLMHHSNIPAPLQYGKQLIPYDSDIPAFKRLSEIKVNIVTFVDQSQNLYIWSDNTGNGKTSWSIKLMLNYFNEIWAGNRYQARGVFVNVPDLLSMIKDNISNPKDDFQILQDNLRTVPLVIWDDICATNMSDYDYSHVMTFIDQRIMAGLSNIYTSNISPDGVIDVLGQRLGSRIVNYSEVVHFKGDDRRAK